MSNLDRIDPRAVRSDRGARPIVEEDAVERDVAEGVEMAVGVVVVVDAHVVLREAERSRADLYVGEHGHTVLGGFGVLGARRRCRSGRLSVTVVAIAHQPPEAAIRSGVRRFEGSPLVVLAPAPPIGDRGEERPETRQR